MQDVNGGWCVYLGFKWTTVGKTDSKQAEFSPIQANHTDQ
jgi:hypothetical protein